MNKSKTRGQLISKLQYMKSQPNGNAIQHICYKDIDNICNYLLEDKNEIERLKEENNKVYHYVSYLQEYCDNLEKALDKACELITEAVSQDCTIFDEVIEDDYMWRTELEEWKEWCLKDVE